MTSLIVSLGAVTGLRALTDWVADTSASEVTAAVTTTIVPPRPPTTPLDYSQLGVLPPAQSTAPSTSLAALASFPTTTLFVPEIRRPPLTVPPPPPPPPPPTTTAVLAPPPTTTGPPDSTTVPPVEIVSYQLTGGSVHVVSTPSAVNLDSASPNEGFVMEVRRSGPVQVTVRFDSPTHVSRLSVEMVRGDLVVSAIETPVE